MEWLTSKFKKESDVLFEEIYRKDENLSVLDYIITAAASLTPMCLENLHKGFAEEDWNLHMACATCINNMSVISGQIVYD